MNNSKFTSDFPEWLKKRQESHAYAIGNKILIESTAVKDDLVIVVDKHRK